MKKDDPFYQAQVKKNRNNFWARYLNVENWINRPLASVLVRLVFRTAVMPNHITVVAFLFGLGAAASFALGTASSAMAAAVLCEISLTLDCADGMLARARNSFSRFGSFLDLFLDRLTDFAVLLGIAIGFYRAGGRDKDRLILGLLAISLYMLQVVLYYIFNRFLDAQSGESGEGRAFGILIFFILGMLNRLDLIIYAMLAETVLNLVFRVSRFLLAGWRAERQRLPL